MTQLLPPKKEVALALLERSNVDVYLDPRARGVVVPPQFRKEPRLILKIGLNMPVPIPDLRLDEESMSCTLSFNRSPFYCVVPWSSVFAMVGEDGRGMVWPDDVPQELAVKVVEPGSENAPASSGSPVSEGAPGSVHPASAGATGRRAARASKLADDGPSSSAASSSSGAARASGAGAGKRKKPSKKDEPSRPMLVAVPSLSNDPHPPQRPEPSVATSSTPSSTPANERRARPERAEQRRDGVSSNPVQERQERARGGSSRIPPTPPPQGARPKRELPPYLRVVK